MKKLTVGEAQGHFAELIAEAHQGAVIVLTDGDKEVWLDPHKPLDLETDNPELEAELLKAVDGPFSPYPSEEMRSIGERIIKAEQDTHVIEAGGDPASRGALGKQSLRCRQSDKKSCREIDAFASAKTAVIHGMTLWSVFQQRDRSANLVEKLAAQAGTVAIISMTLQFLSRLLSLRALLANNL